MIRPCWLPLLFAPLIAAGVVAAEGEPDPEDLRFFNERVYPILESNCFECHGGEHELKGDFRVTSREGLIHGGHFGPGYDAANPRESVLLRMISYRDENHEMPPRGKLPEEDIAVLTEWILERDAVYDPEREIRGEISHRRGFTVTESDREWWAYRPIEATSPPEVDDPAWSGNGIDAFIRKQLDREGLTPNPPAPPEVMVRRVFYDLIGLPPTPEEVDEFLSASARDPEAAYRDLVDDLLARPQYGEKWARHWLDVVRYAETNGFERDNPKPRIWLYRDYIIDAFNDDKPYDQFVVEQIAGDEIAEPTRESLTATGYHRLMQWDDEPADRKQHVYDVLADNVRVTSETFLATTLNCARCHDHKADPISQKDYYSFLSFFGGVTHYRTEGTLISWASEREKEAFEKERAEALDRLASRRHELDEALRPELAARGLLEADDAETESFVAGAAEGGAEWDYTLIRPTPDWSAVGFRNRSWFVSRGGFGPTREGASGGDEPAEFPVRTEWTGPEIWMRAAFGLTAVPESASLQLRHRGALEIYLNGKLVHKARAGTGRAESIPLSSAAVDAFQTGRNTLAVHARDESEAPVLDIALGSESSGADLSRLVAGRGGERVVKKYEEETGDERLREYRRLTEEIRDWESREPGTAINVVTERTANPPPMHVHLRGSAHAPGDEVSPALPAVLAGEGSDPVPVEVGPVDQGDRVSSGRRLALARWLVSEDNPLTARVMVNRIWQHHFGRGIVPSSSDFGRLGEEPTHPELLDWLAHRFREEGWSLKDMHRLILHSRTYRMSSAPDEENLAADPQNHNFWRFSMRRLTAEELRDSILAVSGKLNLDRGGPWVFPKLPPEVLATASRPHKAWPVTEDREEHFRRSVYVHVKRSLRHPMLADFDQATTDSPCAVRFTTTVPTQALSMLNSAFVNEQAAEFADRMRAAADSTRERIAFGLSVLLQREATEEELDHLERLHETFRTEAGLSDKESLDRVALLALNLNEFIYLD